jgi:mono/diheme cytochrome c family protein
VTYVAHCQGCHGSDGDGRGEVAAYLKPPAADLTRLWESYGSPLDRERLAATINGRESLRVHGPRSMPVWGEEFFSAAPPGTANLEEVRAGIIGALVDYLQTLQPGAEATPVADDPVAATEPRSVPRVH